MKTRPGPRTVASVRVDPSTTALSYSWHLFNTKKREKGKVMITRKNERKWRNPVMNHRNLESADH